MQPPMTAIRIIGRAEFVAVAVLAAAAMGGSLRPLVGDRSVNQLAATIDETMPKDDPAKVTGEAARHVAEYIHAAFYSAVARDRNRPARVELSRLTVRQYQQTVADLIASFRNHGPGVDDRRGLRAEYFQGRGFDQKDLVYDHIDPQVTLRAQSVRDPLDGIDRAAGDGHV